MIGITKHNMCEALGSTSSTTEKKLKDTGRKYRQSTVQVGGGGPALMAVETC